MWCIVGEQEEGYMEHYDDGHWRTRETEEVVATFDTKEDAEAYIKWARLKKPSQAEGYGSGAHWFRNKSVLIMCTSARVEKYFAPEHNPPRYNP